MASIFWNFGLNRVFAASVLGGLMIVGLTGCTSSYVQLDNADNLRSIDKPLSKEQVRGAILEGAEAAGWRTKDAGSDRILATYVVRSHTVNVLIDYSEMFYFPRYESSRGLKMFCTEEDKGKNWERTVSGLEQLPGNVPPLYIHGNYKTWVDSLSNSIEREIAAI